MPASNKKCFEKKCLCATCNSLCSMCAKSLEQDCDAGVHVCDTYKQLKYKDFSGKTLITEEMFNSSLGGSRECTK